MGVIAVDVMRHPAAFQENQMYAGDDHYLQSCNSCSITHRKRRGSFKLQALPSPSNISKPRRLLVRKNLSPVALKRPSSVAMAPKFSEPAAADQLLHCSLDLQSASLPAPASGAQPLRLQPNGRRTAGFDHAADDDWPLDYKEAAAVLEQLFTESPSLEDDRIIDGNSSSGDNETGPSSSPSWFASSIMRTVNRSSLVSTKKRCRKDLMARITHRRKKMGLEAACDHVGGGGCAQASKTTLSAVGELSDSIWSNAASKLLEQHGEAVNLMAQNWSKLGRELLSVEEERWLALLMKPAKALLEVRANVKQQLGREVSEEEWAQVTNLDVPTLSRHLALHHAARNKLLKLNLRLVRHQACKYKREAAASSLTAVELCQEGAKGLLVAVDRFDPSKGVRFSTYAIFWIRNSILRAQTRSGYPIRAPFNFAEIKMSIRKVKWEMRLEAGEAVGRKARESWVKRMLERVGVDEERYKVVMQSNRRVVSLHKRDPITGAELIEHLADPNSHHEYAASSYLVGSGATDPSLRLGIDDVLDSLKPKESLVLRQRFGLDGKGERALGEIGRNMRISREMVRRYEARGLLKLKHPTRLDYLRSFLSQDS